MITKFVPLKLSLIYLLLLGGCNAAFLEGLATGLSEGLK